MSLSLLSYLLPPHHLFFSPVTSSSQSVQGTQRNCVPRRLDKYDINNVFFCVTCRRTGNVIAVDKSLNLADCFPIPGKHSTTFHARLIHLGWFFTSEVSGGLRDERSRSEDFLLVTLTVLFSPRVHAIPWTPSKLLKLNQQI